MSLGPTNSASHGSCSQRARAFTLIELLTVIAVIGILAAILFPSLSAARKSANRAKTKVQFSRWAVAIESFRSEYGYYPAFDSTNRVNGGASSTISGDHLFYDILAGKKRDGSDLGTAAAAQNRKRIAFYSFGEGELGATDSQVPYLLKDAFENSSIVVLVDKNLDGVINSTDYAAWPSVQTATGDSISPATTDIPTTGIRAGVALYGPDPDASASDPRLILSWK